MPDYRSTERFESQELLRTAWGGTQVLTPKCLTIYIIYNHNNIMYTELKIVIFRPGGVHFQVSLKWGGIFSYRFLQRPTESMLLRLLADARDRVIYSSSDGFFLGKIHF